MLDFRYHALSLVAVFLALAIGIVLGVTIGDSLLSDAEKSLRGNLRANVVNAREDASKARGQVASRDRMLDQIYPALTSGRLSGDRVALVSWGPLPNRVESSVRDARATRFSSYPPVTTTQHTRAPPLRHCRLDPSNP